MKRVRGLLTPVVRTSVLGQPLYWGSEIVLSLMCMASPRSVGEPGGHRINRFTDKRRLARPAVKLYSCADD